MDPRQPSGQSLTKSDLHIVVGDVSESLSDFARKLDPDAYLIDIDNIDQIHVGTVYVSLGDINDVGKFYNFLSKASKITYHPPTKWSDKKTAIDKYSMAWFTENYIRCVSNQFGLTIDPPISPDVVLDLVDSRRSLNPQLWVAGCSTTYGLGVAIEQRYANLLSTRLDLSVTVLAKVGSSIPWAVDQLLRSDIRENDIVILGATGCNRLTIYNDSRLNHVTVGSYLKNIDMFPEVKIEQFDCSTRIYESLCAIKQLENFCTKLKAKLIVLGIHTNLDLAAELCQYPYFIFCHGTMGSDLRAEWLDVGNDIHRHPGPETHKMYANLIANRLESLYNIKT